MEKKVRDFNQVKEEEIKSQQNFEEFFDIKQVQLMANYIDEFDRSVNLYKRLRVRLFLAAQTLDKTFEAGEDDFSEFLPLSKDLLALSLDTDFSSFNQEKGEKEEEANQNLKEETSKEESATSELPALLEEQDTKEEDEVAGQEPTQETTENTEVFEEENGLPPEEELIPGEEIFPEFSGFFREEDIHLFPGEKPKTSQEVKAEEEAREQAKQEQPPSSEESAEKGKEEKQQQQQQEEEENEEEEEN